jgi:hypothetical protein
MVNTDNSIEEEMKERIAEGIEHIMLTKCYSHQN